jgi:flavin reductase (DIM6/NTAB) family NADH-FMN oxidoreductase RutF
MSRLFWDQTILILMGVRNMEKKLTDATRLLPCSVVFLSVATEDKQDAMTATATFVAESLPLLTVSVSKNSTCHELIEKSGELALNVAAVDQTGLAGKLGASHGRHVNKFKEFSIQTETAEKISAPLIAGSLANIECKVVTSFTASNYVVYLVEAVALKADDKKVPIAWFKDRYYVLDKAAN